jgi:hypothetical protein
MVVFYQPITAADCATAHTLRTICPTDLAGGRAEFTLTDLWDSAGEDASPRPTAPSSPMPIAYNASQQTCRYGDFFELPPAQFGYYSDNGDKYVGQRIYFGTAWADHPNFDILQYRYGWVTDFAARDQLWLYAIRWKRGHLASTLWDVWNIDAFTQPNCFLVASGGTGTNGQVDVSHRPSTDPYDPAYLGDNHTVPNIPCSADGQDVLRVGQYWNAATRLWSLFLWVDTGNTLVAFTYDAALTDIGPGANAAVPPLTNVAWKRLLGWRTANSGDGGDNTAGFFGMAAIDFPTPTTRAEIKTLADHTTKMWGNKVKSLDPRLMTG